MDWQYIAGFFDGEGNINVQTITNKQDKNKILSYQIAIRFYNNDLNVLTKIKDFLGYGSIFINGNRKNKEAAHELSIYRKKEVHQTLLNLKHYSISKQDKISYLLNNFNFGRNNNRVFNLDGFHKLTERRNVENFYIKR